MSDMSFLPEDYLERRIERHTNGVCLILFAVVLSAIVAAFYVTDRQRSQIRRQQAQINADFEDAANRLNQLDQMTQQKQDMVRKARITAQLLERVPRTLVLSELINHMPKSLSLLKFELETKVSKTARARPTTALDAAKKSRPTQGAAGGALPVVAPEVELRIVGAAPTDVEVAQFMHEVSQNPLFDDVSLSFTEQVTIEEQLLRKFQINMRLADGVDAHQFEPKLVK